MPIRSDKAQEELIASMFTKLKNLLTKHLCYLFYCGFFNKVIRKMNTSNYLQMSSNMAELNVGSPQKRINSNHSNWWSKDCMSDSIQKLKSKIKTIETWVKGKGNKPAPRTFYESSKALTQSYSLLRKTTNFLESKSRQQSIPGSKTDKGTTQSLLVKANETIRKSYKLALKPKKDEPDTPDSFSGKNSNQPFSPMKKNPIYQAVATKIPNYRQALNSDQKSKSFVNLGCKMPQKIRKKSDNQSPQKNKIIQHNHELIDIKVTEPKSILPIYLKQFSKRRISNGFLYGQLLGKGKFGEVYIAQHIETGFVVAIKKVSKSRLREFKMVDRFIEEIKLHSRLDHPNIVKFYGFYEEKEHICLVLEYLHGGTLFDYMNQVGTLSTREALSFLREVIEALDYVHEKGICHRDIKPENIVISSSTGLAKLCDFGWSAVTETPRSTFCGTLDYASPEILSRQPYDESVDVWGVGVLTYEMFIGRAPFQNADRQAVIQAIVNIDKSGIPCINRVPSEVREFIEALLQKDPSKRPKMFQLLLFPLFQMEQNYSRRYPRGGVQ